MLTRGELNPCNMGINPSYAAKPGQHDEQNIYIKFR